MYLTLSAVCKVLITNNNREFLFLLILLSHGCPRLLIFRFVCQELFLLLQGALLKRALQLKGTLRLKQALQLALRTLLRKFSRIGLSIVVHGNTPLTKQRILRKPPLSRVKQPLLPKQQALTLAFRPSHHQVIQTGLSIVGRGSTPPPNRQVSSSHRHMCSVKGVNSTLLVKKVISRPKVVEDTSNDFSHHSRLLLSKSLWTTRAAITRTQMLTPMSSLNSDLFLRVFVFSELPWAPALGSLAIVDLIQTFTTFWVCASTTKPQIEATCFLTDTAQLHRQLPSNFCASSSHDEILCQDRHRI